MVKFPKYFYSSNEIANIIFSKRSNFTTSKNLKSSLTRMVIKVSTQLKMIFVIKWHERKKPWFLNFNYSRLRVGCWVGCRVVGCRVLGVKLDDLVVDTSDKHKENLSMKLTSLIFKFNFIPLPICERNFRKHRKITNFQNWKISKVRWPSYNKKCWI